MCQHVLKLAKLIYMYHLQLKYHGFHVKTSLLSVLKTAKGGMNRSISHKSQCIHSVVPQLETTSTSQPSQLPIYSPETTLTSQPGQPLMYPIKQ